MQINHINQWVAFSLTAGSLIVLLFIFIVWMFFFVCYKNFRFQLTSVGFGIFNHFFQNILMGISNVPHPNLVTLKGAWVHFTRGTENVSWSINSTLEMYSFSLPSSPRRLTKQVQLSVFYSLLLGSTTLLWEFPYSITSLRNISESLYYYRSSMILADVSEGKFLEIYYCNCWLICRLFAFGMTVLQSGHFNYSWKSSISSMQNVQKWCWQAVVTGSDSRPKQMEQV